MKTLIIYASKHGCTEKCSMLLKDKLHGEVITVNIKKETLPDISLFHNIIIGGSIYIGKIQKEVSEFCSRNLNVLKEKKIGLFICGMQKIGKADMELKKFFSEELLTHSSARDSFGGEFIFKNMNFLERFIVRKVSKIDKDTSNISEENINKFAHLMNKI